MKRGASQAASLSPDQLFDGNDSLFKKVASEARVYGEYGCGASTLWMTNNSSATIFAVDSSQQWAESINKAIAVAKSDGIQRSVEWINLGDIGEWGTPLSYDRRDSFIEYFNSPWKHDKQPDTVLIDGRFRVACFLVSLIKSKPGTKLLFDDYTNRQIYHVVERYCAISDTCGRQALFIRPNEVDNDLIENEIKCFYHVMD